ncbi:sugar ABC transporter permease [Variovorax dokdonensis]|uniref:Sugar ABC transporter permease n=1 Tax=Variovorax dokdonensis TaxID=344883 RepID=A0ABT7NA48_9BURK|nr:sugar ABC transporter permease [Variovorax dokdonensis]MDM0044820.1 sugar ABC transporter permease [Variovorax dokdonensis]
MAGDRAKGPGGLAQQRVRAAWTFLAPTLIVLALVAGWPLARTLWFGFTDAALDDLGAARFIGLANFLERDGGEWYGVLADSVWWHAVWRTVWFAAVSVSLETVLGLVVALALNVRFPLRGVVRAAILIPWAIPTVVSARMWGWMLNDQFGILNHILMGLGLIDHPVAWTADPDLAMWAVVMVDVWKATPFMALLTLAALQMLPGDCYEAARVDGIHPVRVFFRVTLPLIRPALMVAVIFRALDALRVFDLIYVLTANSRDTQSMSVYARQWLVDFQEVGYGSAASTLLFLVIVLLTWTALVLGRVRLQGETR